LAAEKESGKMAENRRNDTKSECNVIPLLLKSIVGKNFMNEKGKKVAMIQGKVVLETSEEISKEKKNEGFSVRCLFSILSFWSGAVGIYQRYLMLYFTFEFF